MLNDEEEMPTEEPEDKDFIEVHLKIPKPEAPDVVVVPPPKAPDIHITNIQVAPAKPAEKIVIPTEKEPKPPARGEMKPSGYSTAQKVQKFGSTLEKTAVEATQEFKRRGFTIKDSRAS